MGYIPEALDKRVPKKGQKRRWLRLSDKPLTKEHALDRASYAVDQSISARGRIRPVKDVKEFGSVKRAGYFSQTKPKYRFYKIKKGKRVPLENKFIERTFARIDSSGEKEDLKLSKLIKQEGWIQPKKKGRKKKS